MFSILDADADADDKNRSVMWLDVDGRRRRHDPLDGAPPTPW